LHRHDPPCQRLLAQIEPECQNPAMQRAPRSYPRRSLATVTSWFRRRFRNPLRRRRPSCLRPLQRLPPRRRPARPLALHRPRPPRCPPPAGGPPLRPPSLRAPLRLRVEGLSRLAVRSRQLFLRRGDLTHVVAPQRLSCPLDGGIQTRPHVGRELVAPLLHVLL